MEILEISSNAKEQLGCLIREKGKDCIGLRLAVLSRGCTGQAYTMEYAYEIKKDDEQVECGDFKLLIEGKSLIFYLGSTMDFVTNQLSAGFVFNNPNVKGQCGCGESFHF